MAIVVPVISTFDAKGITKAISNFQKLEGGAAKTGFVLRAMDQGVTKLVTSLAKAGAAIGVVGGIIGTKLVGAAYESQKVMAQTEAILRSTQSTAGHTADSIAALSERMSEKIGIDDEVIQKSANLLLTFKQVRNGVGEQNAVFDRAIQASADLGNVFGSIEGAAMQMGKALADPVTGMNALRRSGVNFTESQRETIKSLVETGDLLGAQKIILQEVESQVGGTAEATATDFDRMKVAVGNTAEQLGAVLIPYVERFARFVKDQVVPYIKELIQLFQEEGLGGVIRKISGDFLNFLGDMGKTGDIIYTIVTALAMLKAAVIAYNVATTVATAITRVFNITLAANPIGLIAAAIAALIVLIVAMYLKFDWFRKGVNAIINGVIAYFEFMANAWIFAINIVIKGVNAVRGILSKFGIDLPKVAELGEVSFGRVGVAASKATGKIKDMAEAIMKAKNAERMAMEAANKPADTGGGGGGGESPLERAQRQLKEYTDALNNVKKSQTGLKDASRALADANAKVASSAQAVKDAQNGLRLATDNVRKAEENLERVRRGLGPQSDESKKALSEVEEAQRALEESGYSFEEAQFKVADATAKLSELRKQTEAPTAREVREAEIELARAKLGLTERSLAQKQATAALSDAQKNYNEITNGAKEDTDRYKEAMKELTEAKEAQDEAAQKVMKALEDEREAIDKVTEAQDKLKDATWAVFDAEKALRELRSQIPAAIRQEARADVAAREAGSAPGVTIPSMPLVPDFVPTAIAMNSTDGTQSVINNYTINSQSLNPAESAEYVVEALRAYERSNGFIPVRVDSAVYAV